MVLKDMKLMLMVKESIRLIKEGIKVKQLNLL